MEPLVFVLIVLVGSWVIARGARKRGQSPSQCVCLLIGLSMFGAVIFGILAIVAGCGMWGFDHPPPWERQFLLAAVLAGAVCGVAVAFLVARRVNPRRVRERREAEADYDELGSPGPPEGPAPPR